ncbi:hypothetical protein F5Y16DRAFT_389559 [Xylariaceae sp. FL0255]|nr:hypothetical protein F5Y16DRAFT_389559 [Xylariaceae sp. FL0255]
MSQPDQPTLKISRLPAFDPPGCPYVDDGLTSQQKSSWSTDNISKWMNEEISAKDDDGNSLTGGGGVIRTPLTQFFNGTFTPYDIGQKPVPISWIGFPKLVEKQYPNEPQRWLEADKTRDVQDEYLEWTVQKNDRGQILGVTFTCEGPEYWSFLAKCDIDKVFSLYKSLYPTRANEMRLSDLLDDNGVYKPDNKWNSLTPPGTIMHLIQRNNSLGAEIDIVAQATVLRKDPQGNPVTDMTKLINCSRYGNANRNSDPHIGDVVNKIARGGTSVSIANPVAIYMMSVDFSTLMLDINGTGQGMVPVPAGAYQWVRGNINKQMGLRLHIQIPDGWVGKGPENNGHQLTVSDIVDTGNNENIQYASQFADYITMGTKGVGISPVPKAELQFCPKPPNKTVFAMVSEDREVSRKVGFRHRH